MVEKNITNMIKKKIYITPLITFDEIEEATGLCDISAGAGNQGAGGTGGWGGAYAKSADYFCLDDPFEDPYASSTEEESNEFQYTLDY